MSEAGNAVKKPAAARANVPSTAGNRVAELKVSGHLMTLDSGMFCIFHAPGGTAVDDGSGLPGVRISLPPSPSGSPSSVSISTFRSDGWLDFSVGAALVRVEQGPAPILVTIYQSLAAGADTAPRLQVLRLTPDAGAAPQAGAAGPGHAVSRSVPIPASADIVAHVQRAGDVAGQFGAWTGTRGSGSWIEGFAVTPPAGVGPQDLEYQAVLGRGWLSPWIEGGKFCGSRGMALPLLGLNVRLKGDAAKTHECSYFATFVDGSSVGPVPAGEACQADSLAALEAFQIVLRRRGAATAPESVRHPPARHESGRHESGPHEPAPHEPIRSTRPKVAAPTPKPGVGRTKVPVPPPAKPVTPAAKRSAARPTQRPVPRRSR
jgi:hypothetical protein